MLAKLVFLAILWIRDDIFKKISIKVYQKGHFIFIIYYIFMVIIGLITKKKDIFKFTQMLLTEKICTMF